MKNKSTKSYEQKQPFTHIRGDVNNTSNELRSQIMRSVRSSGNKSTEKKLVRIFKSERIRGWRRSSKLFGKPDFIFPKSHIALFADGCFWHGHNCRGLTPKENALYWAAKIARNRKRDRLVTKTLRSKGWKVIRIWECQINRDVVKRKLSTIINT
jgi:DNA mismatch endonuclease, patch repair protein